jgi:protein-S-isoprenylcysteine O-methyltransferase Ste14
MIAGVAVVNPRVAPLAGACAVIVLQLVRIRAEERLLRSTFPGFETFARTTRYRLIPFIW